MLDPFQSSATVLEACAKRNAHLNGLFLPEPASSILSLTFEAELAVGRIIRSRKDEGAALEGDFGIDAVGSAGGFDCLGRVGIGGCCCFGRTDGLREALLMVEERRLRVRFVGGESPCLAAEDAVGATRCAGSFTGRVGDRGFGLTKPPVVTVVPDDVRGFGLLSRSAPAVAS